VLSLVDARRSRRLVPILPEEHAALTGLLPEEEAAVTGACELTVAEAVS